MAQGNEQNMAAIEQAMQAHQMSTNVQAGTQFTEGESIDFTAASGRRYQGLVVFRRPNALDFMRMGGIKSELLRAGGVKDMDLVDNMIAFMAHVISHIEVLTVKRPEWLLNPREMEDTDVLFHVYGKYEVWEQNFRVGVPKAQASDSGAAADTKAVDA